MALSRSSAAIVVFCLFGMASQWRPCAANSLLGGLGGTVGGLLGGGGGGDSDVSGGGSLLDGVLPVVTGVLGSGGDSGSGGVVPVVTGVLGSGGDSGSGLGGVVPVVTGGLGGILGGGGNSTGGTCNPNLVNQVLCGDLINGLLGQSELCSALCGLLSCPAGGTCTSNNICRCKKA